MFEYLKSYQKLANFEFRKLSKLSILLKFVKSGSKFEKLQIFTFYKVRLYMITFSNLRFLFDKV